MGFAARGEAGVERDQRLVPAEGGWQRGGEQGTAQACASAGDVTLAFVLSAVVVEGCEAGQGGGLLAADAAELGHADDERQRGALADAGNAAHEIEAMPEIVISPQLPRDASEFGRAPCLCGAAFAADYVTGRCGTGSYRGGAPVRSMKWTARIAVIREKTTAPS